MFDADTGEVTGLVVRKGVLFTEDVELPAALVASADNGIGPPRSEECFGDGQIASVVARRAGSGGRRPLDAGGGAHHAPAAPDRRGRYPPGTGPGTGCASSTATVQQWSVRPSASAGVRSGAPECP